ncbi:MAG: arylsulfatase [Verrucomicrobiota bacterium]
MRKTLLLILSLAMSACHSSGQQPPKNPNVIYILADDLGYGDLSCYGQQKLKTPHIDRIAQEGIQFSDHYSGNTVCSPSRAVLMTGQHPGHVHCRGNGNENQFALDPKMVTLPRLFKNAGYTTGAFGKWGLGQTHLQGAPNPMTHGFDHFTGWKSQVIAHTYYPSSLVRDGVVIPLEKGTYVHDLIMADAFQFVEDAVASGKPFFCYIPTAVPHAAMHAPVALHEKWRKVFPEFEGKTGKYGAGKGEDCPPVKNPVAGFAAMIENLDTQVGELMHLLNELGVDENTIILFASDNGAHKEGGHHPDFWDSNGPLRGLKRDLYEGGIRTPFMVRWPGVIQPGRKSSHVSAFWDVLPTLADLIGQPIPEQNDGISFLPTLINEGEQSEHPYIYHEFIRGKAKPFSARSLREGNWKALQLVSQKKGQTTFEPIELYDLKADLSESKDLAEDYPEIVARMEQLMDQAHTPLK